MKIAPVDLSTLLKEISREDIKLIQGTESALIEFLRLNSFRRRNTKADFYPPIKKFQRAVCYLIHDEPFYAHLIQDCVIHWTDQESFTMGVCFKDHNYHLRLGTQYADSLSMVQCVGDLKHEMLHIINKHISRGKKYTHEAFNLASDMAIDQYVRNDGYYKDYQGIYYDQEDFKWKPSKTAEFYYYSLLESSKQHMPCKTCNGSRMVIVDKPITSGTLIFAQAQGPFPLLPSTPCPKCNGMGSIPQKNDGSHGCYYSPGGIQYGGGGDPNADNHSEWKEGDSDSKESEGRRLRQMIINAASRAKRAKRAGSIPDAIKELIEEWLNPKVPWQAVFRKYLSRASLIDVKYTRRRPNRRFFYLYPAKKDHVILDILFIIDTSASVGKEDLIVFYSEIDYAYNLGYSITIMEIDAKVQKVYKYEGRIKTKIEPTGRGGTDFQPAFDYIKEHNLCPSLAVYLTDGYCFDKPRQPKKYPVLFCYTPSHRRMPWGDHLVLEYGHHDLSKNIKQNYRFKNVQ